MHLLYPPADLRLVSRYVVLMVSRINRLLGHLQTRGGVDVCESDLATGKSHWDKLELQADATLTSRLNNTVDG